MLTIMSVVNVGCYIWIDNSHALVPGVNSTASVTLDNQIDLSDDSIDSEEDADKARSQAQGIIRGNGDQDDNRTESYLYRRTLPTALPANSLKSSSTFDERYTAAGYKDFGHLKVMPAGDGFSNNLSIMSFKQLEASRLMRAASSCFLR